MFIDFFLRRNMKLRVAAAALALGGLQALGVSEAAQLPGSALLFEQNNYIESKSLRGYNTHSRRLSATTTAALVRNLGSDQALPTCAYLTGEPTTIFNAVARTRGIFLFMVYETKADGVSKGRRIFKSCSAAPQLWPPTGDQLFVASYPGALLSPSVTCFACFETLLLLSKHPSLQTTALEWTAW